MLSVDRVISGALKERDLVDDDRLRACHPLGLELEGSLCGCAMVWKMIYDVMAKRVNGFPSCYTERQVTGPNRTPDLHSVYLQRCYIRLQNSYYRASYPLSI